MKLKALFLVYLFPFLPLVIQAQESPDIKASGFTAAVSPLYPFIGGYGVKAFYDTPKRWSFGLLSEGAFELPEASAEQFFENGENITVDWDYSIGAEVRYRFDRPVTYPKGLYAFATLGYEGWTISKADDALVVPQTDQRDAFDNWFSSLGVGYNWYPLKNRGLWVGASYNVIFILNNTEDRNVNGETYNIRPIVPPSFLPNIYLGWSF